MQIVQIKVNYCKCDLSSRMIHARSSEAPTHGLLVSNSINWMENKEI